MEKKNEIYFLGNFPVAGNKEKKTEKKKIYAENRFGLLPKQYGGEIFCISIEGIVLQECIAMWWA